MFFNFLFLVFPGKGLCCGHTMSTQVSLSLLCTEQIKGEQAQRDKTLATTAPRATYSCHLGLRLGRGSKLTKNGSQGHKLEGRQRDLLTGITPSVREVDKS